MDPNIPESQPASPIVPQDNAIAHLETQISELRDRVRRLEDALVAGDPLHNQVSTPAAVSRPPIPAAFPPEAVLKIAPGASPRPDGRSLENRIGSQWFNRIGILAVLIGMSWFLKLAIDNHWIGPLGRVLIGLVAGSAIVAWSERFQHRGYAVFGYSLKGLGSGILYLSLWAAYSLFHLMPAAAAFTAMVAVTAFNGFMAWMQDSELLALYSIVGGLSTPLLLSTGENHEISLFSYLLVLDLAVLLLVILRPWSRLLAGAFAGTVFFFAGWWLQFYSSGLAWPTASFVTVFFLMFAIAPRLVRVDLQSGGYTSGWDNLALIGMPLANAALAFLALYALCGQSGSDWATAWLAVGFAAFYLLLLRLPARGLETGKGLVLSNLHLTVAVVFLTIAIPLKAHGRWLTIGWLVQGAALLWVARRVRLFLLRVLALLCLSLGLFALLIVRPSASTTPLFNQRFGTYCVAIAVFAFVLWLARNAESSGDRDQGDTWSRIAAAAVLAVNALILIAASWEIHNYWWFVHWRGNGNLLHEYRMYAQFTYSAFFMLFGAVLLGIGFWQRSAFLRWQALVLIAAAIGKVFVLDASALSQGYRILSFLGLGVLLLAVSFIYQRDWLHLRGETGQKA